MMCNYKKYIVYDMKYKISLGRMYERKYVIGSKSIYNS